MVKKISGHDRSAGGSGERKQLHAKRLKVKGLHKHSVEDIAAIQGLSPDQLPPASTSNAARQARSRLNITFPVDWQALHLKKTPENDGEFESEPGSERAD